jgi:hypothetical protein
MTTEAALLLLTGLVLGMRHAFDRDHLAAVTHFISLEPDPVKSAWFGVRWAVGHAVAALGSLLVLLRVQLDPSFGHYAELVVGLTLVGLGAWRLALLIQERRHTHAHAHGHHKAHIHEHSHEPGRDHVHRFAPVAVGLVHGAAGAPELFLLIPVTLMGSPAMTYGYIGLFSVGVASTMGLYGYMVGRFYRRAGQAGQRIYRLLVIATSLSGILLGVIWISRAL